MDNNQCLQERENGLARSMNFSIISLLKSRETGEKYSQSMKTRTLLAFSLQQNWSQVEFSHMSECIGAYLGRQSGNE